MTAPGSRSRLRSTITLLTLAEIPTIEVVLFEDAPTPLNPMGVKGAGEVGFDIEFGPASPRG